MDCLLQSPEESLKPASCWDSKGFEKEVTYSREGLGCSSTQSVPRGHSREAGAWEGEQSSEELVK